MILPVEYPPITTFHQITDLFTILWARKKEIMPWFADHYIQLIVKDDDPNNDWITFYDILFTDYVRPASRCPYFSMQVINRAIPYKELETFTDFVEMQINNGYYINVCLNQFHLQCSGAYNKHNYVHDTFIYGYDRGNNKIYIADFYDNQKYAFKTATYQEINQSNMLDGIDIPYWASEIVLYKYDTSCPYQTNTILLKQSLKDYLLGEDNLGKYIYTFDKYKCSDKCSDPNIKKPIYGVDCYDAISKHCLEFKKDLDAIALHLLYDHKTAMQIRLNYLYENNYLHVQGIETLMTLYAKLRDDTLILRNLSLKYKLHGSDEFLEKLVAKCQTIKENDKKLTSEILQRIK